MEFIKKNWLKITVFVIILAFYASFMAVKISLPHMDNDAGLYISDGKLIWENKALFRTNPYSYIETGFPIVNHHWLSSVVFYLTSETFGFAGLTILKIIILLSAFSILFLAATKKADFWLVAALSLPVILMLKDRVRIRPEMFSYLFIALFLWLLFNFEKNPKSKAIYWLVPLELLWVNFHIFFFMGIALTAGFLFEKIFIWLIDRKAIDSGMIKKLLIILFLLIAVCFINPNGLAGVKAPFVSHNYSSFSVAENQPLFNFKASILSWDFKSSAFIPMVVIFLLSVMAGFRQNNIFLVFSGLVAIAAGLIYLRLVTLFAIIFLAAAPANFNFIYLNGRKYFFDKVPRLSRAMSYVLILAIILVYPSVAIAKYASGNEMGYTPDFGIGLDKNSAKAGEFFRNNNLQGPIFNDYDIGGYIIYNLYPEEKVFVDNNGADSYPSSFFEELFLPMFSDENFWQAKQEEYKINAIFISMRDGSPAVGMFLWNRLHDPLWALVYVDTYNIILVKNVPANQEIISRHQITAENVKDKIGPLLASADIIDRAVGGRLLYLIGREDLSTSVLKKVVAKYPKSSWVWLYMGSIKVLKNDPESIISAVVFLENAVNMGEKTADGYTWLGLAYFRSAQFDKAKESLHKALWLEPGRYDATTYLTQLQSYLDEQKLNN